LNTARGNRELDLVLESSDWGVGPRIGSDFNGFNVEMFYAYDNGEFPSMVHPKHLLMNDRAYRRPVGSGINPTSYSYAMFNPCGTNINAPQ